MALLICKLLTGTYKVVSQFKRRRSILILVAVFLQHNINSVMYRKEEASDSLNNKLETLSTIMSLSVLNNFELCYRGTSFKVQGGFGNCCVFWPIIT